MATSSTTEEAVSSDEAPTTLSRTEETLYAVAWVQPAEPDEDYSDDPEDYEPDADPEGWADYCTQLFGEYKPFFWPSTKRLYTTRRSAEGRAGLVNHWGGRAVVVVAEVKWVPLDEMDARWEKQRLAERRVALHRELEEIETALFHDEMPVL